MMLMVAMVVTMLPKGQFAKAAPVKMDVHFHFYDKDQKYAGKVFIQYWGGSAELSTEETTNEDWTVKVNPLEAEASEGADWYGVTFKGTCEGFQFLDEHPNTTKNYTGSVFNAAMKDYTGDLYYMDGIWYKENPVKKTDAAKLEIIEPKDEYYMVGPKALFDSEWDNTDLSHKFTKNDDGTYSYTLNKAPAGNYECKALKDPVNFGWDIAWGGAGNGGNYVLELEVESKVIFTLDPNDSKYQLKATIVPLKASSGLKSPVYNEDGTLSFFYESAENTLSIGVKGNLASTQKKTMIKAALSKEKLSNGNYVYAASSAAIKEPGVYSYSFYSLDKEGAIETKLGDPASKTQYGDGGAFVRNPVVNAKGLVTIYYPYDGKGAQVYYKNATASNKKELKVGDKVTGQTAEEYGYKTVPMTVDSEFTGGGMYSAQFFDEDGTYNYVIVQNDKVIDDAFNYGEQTFTEKNVDKVALGVKSPTVINNEDGTQSVKFMYYDADKTVTKVQVAGEFTDWQSGAVSMTEDENNKGVWSVTIPNFVPGAYQYKFILNGGSWTADPLCKILYGNDGNSIVVVGGLKLSADVQLQKGESVTLPASAQLFTNAMAAKDVDVAYELKDATAKGVTLSGNTLSVEKDFAEDSVDLVISSGDYKLNYSVSVVGQMYSYTIHYLADDTSSYSNRDMWIWPQVGKSYNTGYVFNEKNYTDAKGRVWATATYKFPTDALYVIVRSKGNWDYQEGQRALNIKAGETSGEFWILQEAAKAFDAYADEFETGARYVVVEYERDNADYEDWNLYTWNATANYNLVSNFFTKDKSGKYTTTFTISENTDKVNFLIRKGTPVGDDWSNIGRDVLGDRAIDAPLDQKVIKVKLQEGQTEVSYLPYTKGYDLDPDHNQIKFYYRDENLYLKNTQESLKNVIVNVNNEDYQMEYDKTNQRYQCDYTANQNGNYQYCYKVTNASGTSVFADAYNTNKTEDGKKSIVRYENNTAKVNVTIANPTITAGQNRVLTVELDNKNIEISKLYADLSALGGKKKVAIDSELKKLSFGVTDNTSIGKKTIEVTAVDKFNKSYTGTATVTVNQKNGANKDWDESIIYFMVTDRFSDGNAENNDAYGVGDYDLNGPSSYHGGDFAGVTNKLDYLKDLGVNTIWITPIVENITEGQKTSEAGITSYGYHGYWASDFEKLNKHLGTVEELHTLIKQAHARGIKIMVDVVLNHAGYEMNNTEKFKGMFHESVAGNDILEWQDGLPDFATENENVRNQLINWQKAWVSEIGKTSDGDSIDYFRVDTVKHVDSTTWSAFKNAMIEVSDNFKMIGEYYGASATNDYDMLNSGKMDSLLDFNFNDMATNFANGQLENTEKQMESRNAALTSTGTYGSFLNSHDEVGYKFNLEKTYSKDQADALSKVAASLNITAKGQPIIYYGEEIGLTGDNNYPYQDNRYDMKFDNLSADENAMLAHYKKMLAIRNANSKVFAKGTRTSVGGSDEEKYIAFERSYQGKNIVVALNIENKDKTVELVLKDFAGEQIVDEYSGIIYNVGKNGKVTVTIPANAKGGTAVFTSKDEAAVKTVSAEELKSAKEMGVSKVVNALDEATNEVNATWTFANSDLKKTNASNIGNVAVTCKVMDATSNAEVAAILEKDSNNTNGAVVKLSQSGNLPVSATVKVFLGNQSAIAYGSKVNVYRVNGTKLQEVTKNVTKVSADGYVTLQVAQGGTYVLLSKAASSKVVSKLVDTVTVKLASTLSKGKTTSVKTTVPASVLKVSAFTETNLGKIQSAQVAAVIKVSSANSKVIKVLANGKLKAVKKGTAKVTVTVRLSNGQKKNIVKTIKVK